MTYCLLGRIITQPSSRCIANLTLLLAAGDQTGLQNAGCVGRNVGPSMLSVINKSCSKSQTAVAITKKNLLFLTPRCQRVFPESGPIQPTLIRSILPTGVVNTFDLNRSGFRGGQLVSTSKSLAVHSVVTVQRP
jgi:hypothetical protein